MTQMTFDPSNVIHPTTLIHPAAKIGKRNTFGPYCVVEEGVEIGDDNQFTSYVSIGMPAEHKDYFKKLGRVRVGSRNVVREFVTVHSSTKGVTRVGSDCILLKGCYISHDSVIEDRVTVSINAMMGGETYVMTGANLGMGCVLHQRQVVGSYAMIGMGAVAPKKAELMPGGVYVGNPARFIKQNLVGLERGRVGADALAAETERYRDIRRQGVF